MTALIQLDAPATEMVSDLWEALQDMHQRAKYEPGLMDDPAFIARLRRAHERFCIAFQRWCK